MVGCDLARMALVAGIAVPAGPFWALCTLLVAAELLSAPFGAARAAAAARGAPGRPVRRRQCRQQRHHPGRPGARLRRRRRAGGRARHLGHLGPRRGDVRGVRRVALARATAPTRAAGSGDRYQVGLAAALGGGGRPPGRQRRPAARARRLRLAGLLLRGPRGAGRPLRRGSWRRCRHRGPADGAAPARRPGLMGPLAVLSCTPRLGGALHPGVVVSLALWAVSGLGTSYQLVADSAFVLAVPAACRDRARRSG